MQIHPPPSYLKYLLTDAATEIKIKVQEEYGDNTTVFITNITVKKIIQTWMEEFQCPTGIMWGVDENDEKILLFDESIHGYNGELSIYEYEKTSTAHESIFPSGTKLVMAFQYSGDEEECVLEGKSKFMQDYFGWLAVYKYYDGKLEEIFSYECS